MYLRQRVFGYPGALLLCIVWTFVGTLSYVRHDLQNLEGGFAGSLLAGYITSLACFLPWIPLSAVLFHIERHFPLGQRGWARSAAALVVISVPVSYVASGLTTLIALGVQTLFQRPPDFSTHMWPIPFVRLLGHEFLYWSSVFASWMLRASLEMRENERHTARLMLEKSQLETSLRQAELDALRMRLDPHFLFNSLQNISTLTQHDPQTAGRMLTRLGDLLRLSLRRNSTPETTLRAEVMLVDAYLAIERMRFDDRLSATMDLDPGTERALVPSLLLQPLVENAIRHGLSGFRDRGVIAIRSHIEDDSLVLTVTDNGVGPPAEPLSELGLGIGLGATCERLALLYPGQHTFSMCALPEGGTEVCIALPLRFEIVTETPYAHAATVDRRR